MKFGRWMSIFLLGMVCSLGLINEVSAQGTSLLAFVNNSGQLVVASADGSSRWIVTNPGETLANPLGFSWSPDGRQLFFAVNQGGETSLRVGDVGSQSAFEIGRISGAVSGGEWSPDGNGVLIAVNDTISLVDLNGNTSTVAGGTGASVSIPSPFTTDRPNLAQARALSSDGNYVFYWQNGGYVVQSIGGSPVTLPGSNDANARQSGLWSDVAPLVAYWGFDGTAVLSVTDAASGQTVTLNSGRSAPITPVGWRPGTTQLVYRDASSFARVADLSCLSGGCGSNPLESGAELLPASASEIQVTRDWVYFIDGEQIQAVNLGCVNNGNCAGSIVPVGGNVAPQTGLHAAGNTLAYTAYNQDPYNPADRTAMLVNLSCLSGGGCQPFPLVGGGTAGLVSPDGQSFIVERNGLFTARASDGALTELSGAGAALNSARWG
jgi:hypothetical protein